MRHNNGKNNSKLLNMNTVLEATLQFSQGGGDLCGNREKQRKEEAMGLFHTTLLDRKSTCVNNEINDG